MSTLILTRLSASLLGRRQARLAAALRRARADEARMRQIADHSGEVNWMIDCATSQLLYISPQAGARFGLGQAETDELIAQLAHDLPARLRRFEQGDGSRRQLRREFDHVRKDGSPMALEIVSTLVDDGHGRAVSLVGLVRGIGERRAQEQAQKRFASMISHEFRSPLATIDGAIQRLEMTSSHADEATRKRYRKIQTAVDRLLALIDEYLSPERLAAIGRPARANHIGPLLLMEQAAAAARAADGERHPVMVEAVDLPTNVRCDPDGMRMCLSVLLDNACKYTPAGAAITLLGQPAVEGGIEWLVRDHGAGVPAAALPLVFDKSFRGSNIADVKGSGLGLYLARSVIDVHGGKLSVQNMPGAGAEFRIWLPIPADSGEKPCA
ncbi:MAG: PAS domain-containing sensor histidine kinase [Pseudomonadota bacterium]